MAKTKKADAATRSGSGNRYDQIITAIFKKHYRKGERIVRFERDDVAVVAYELGIQPPKNFGDPIYAFKYRKSLPISITATEPKDKVWAVVNIGRARHAFKLVRPLDLTPRAGLVIVKIPDATPELVGSYALGDEQSLLAKIRYNRLIDVFLGIVAYSLQNHLRTTVKEIGQIEVDELYVGVDRTGKQFIVPVEAKGKKDRAGWQQTMQDIAYCEGKFPQLICRSVTAQLMPDNRIAMFELAADKDDNVSIVDERHYELVPAKDISAEDLASYKKMAKENKY